MGGGKGSSKTSSYAADTLANLATAFSEETSDVRSGLVNAMENVLTTGGTNLPIISRSVEASRQAGSKALEGVTERLAQAGLSGTPEGESIRAKTAMRGDISAGQTGQQLAQGIFNAIPNFILGQQQAAFSGLAGAVPGTSTTRENAKAFGK